MWVLIRCNRAETKEVFATYHRKPPISSTSRQVSHLQRLFHLSLNNHLVTGFVAVVLIASREGFFRPWARELLAFSVKVRTFGPKV
jgi:hypothetical protein